MALSMIQAAESSGALLPGGLIVEATAGNPINNLHKLRRAQVVIGVTYLFERDYTAELLAGLPSLVNLDGRPNTVVRDTFLGFSLTK